MEWNKTDAQNLAIIDSEIDDNILSPAEYEIVRRVIYTTADFEYQSLINFSQSALQSGAAAIAARTTLVVDVPMVKAGIADRIQNTFANPVYCSTEAPTRPQKEKSHIAWGLEALAKRYPECIFIIGQDQTALTALINLITLGEIKPALVVATPVSFVDVSVACERLRESGVPNITINGRKGGASVAVAIIDALIDLAWQAYGESRE
ncbi:MAG: precorrin-8X methylmutase [Calothrix sp. SM1_7_51]|nr:precorrin-8X methylmutase [Calothrix sp. SM1_7_51]